METGEPITGNPLVTVVKVNTEITQAPQVKFNQDENGYARFSWKEVPGAQEYFLFTINKADGAWNDYINVIAATDETEWTAEPSMSIDGTEVITINDRFTRYTYEEDYGDYPVIEEYMGVIAVSDTGNSHISNQFDCYELAHMMPYGIAYDMNEEMNDISYEGTLNLPTMMAIDMCDGSISQRVIEYDKGSIDKTEEGFYYTIECKEYGTPFADRFLVLEQELVINQYLCDIAEYDNRALESVVVTGYLEGNLPHAWNKVRIDGQWNIVDSTNNDNEVIQKALLNLSDTAAYTMLVEDDRFVLDDYRYDYDAPSDENEYYRITDRYFTMDEITDMLVEAIQSEGSAILRTEYDLDDTTFNMIAQETANGAQADIAGFHWMGVIRLEQR